MILFYVLVLTLPLANHWLLGGAQQDNFAPVKFVGFACLPVALFRLASKPKSPMRISGVGVAFSVYFVIAVFSYFAHGNAVIPWTVLLSILSMLVFFVITTALVDSPDRLRRTMLTMIGSVAIASVYTIRDWMFNRSIPDYRPGSISGDANYFALAAAPSMLIALSYVLGHRSRKEKLYISGCLVCTSIAFLMAASRGGFVALAVGVLFLISRSGKGLRAPLVLLALLVPLLVFVPNTTIQRLFHPGYGDEKAVEARKTTWQAGLRMVRAHPLAGVGLGAFEWFVVNYEDPQNELIRSLAHNTYIEIAAELGIPGLVAWLSIFIASFRVLGRFARSGVGVEASIREPAIALQAGLLAIAVGAFFVSASWFRFLWLVLFLPMCLPVLAERSQQLVPYHVRDRDMYPVRTA